MDALQVWLFVLAVAIAWSLWIGLMIRLLSRQPLPPPTYIHVPACPHTWLMYRQLESGHLHWWCTECGWQRWSITPFVPTWTPPAATVCGCVTCQENGCQGWCRCEACHQQVCDG